VSDDLDMLAVQRDDRLLDGLGARRPVDWEDAADPVASLLAALAADVDATPIPASLDDGVARVSAARRRLLASRVAIAAGVTGVVVFASGVAAAVTGDPLAPLAPIRRVIATVAEQVAPTPSKPEAVHRALDGAHDALARGDRETAAKLITDAQGQIDELEDPPPGDLQAELQTLLQQLRQQAAAEQRLKPSAAASTPAADAGLATSGPTAEASPETTTTAGPTGTAEPSSDPTPPATETPPGNTGTPTDEPGSPQPDSSPPSPPADASSVPGAAPDRPRAPEQVGAASDAAAPARDPARGAAADPPARDAAPAPRPAPAPAPDPAPAPAPAPDPAPDEAPGGDAAPGPAEPRAVPDLTEALVTDVVAAAQTVPEVLRQELPVNR
jgi:hypothetical protein